MHPEMLRALARARHEDLLYVHRAQRQPRARPDSRSPRFARSRQRMGSLLISVGARLLGEQRAALELTHE
jgi:hypothetical protein